ncbi:MAG: MerR family transcriptional regulator [Gammaproteobacteria bacterium]|nr:MerR family transcriptional regulator [Gammaproteobacteria bacterium]
MIDKEIRVTEITSVIVDDRIELTLKEVCKACRVDQAAILELVEEGIIEPSTKYSEPRRFSAVMLPRIARALRLQRDLELNTAGVAFALDLLGEIESLRKRLKRLSPQEDFSDE